LTTAPTNLAIDHSCVEARGLALGMRTAWRLRLPAEQVPAWRSAYQERDLHVAASNSAYATTEGGVLQRSAGAAAVHLVVIATSEQIARQCLRDEVDNADRDEGDDPNAWAATVDTHRRLGRAYGYPDCCVTAFCDGWLEAIARRDRVVSDNAVLILRAHLRSKAWHPLLRAFGAGLGDETDSPLRHLPCRFDCPKSLALAEALVADLTTSNPRQAERYAAAVVRPIVVAADGTVAQLGDGGTAPVQVEPTTPVAGLGARFPLVLPFGG